MLVLHATMHVEPAHRERVLELLESLVEASRQDSGVVSYQAAVDVLDPTVVHFREVYENESLFEDHLYSDHVQAFEAEITEYLTAERDIRKFHVESVERLDL
ncbi:putative quinol monooxygenase [Haloarcula onubensis]|uniref:Antibiotic biosynthesis monooxygenase n=1 Tax=Haloarcula onubensis TaxID=2950539 RepID=A0ABU2FMC8_9EURY|nr:putative quinol monooxygenase [Halomicroarcula sp. S3CR25-11]MDS0281920.1 antibiotic biosynthesis monooxygenase [Halomicroarcula sp. S3CR25-11]